MYKGFIGFQIFKYIFERYSNGYLASFYYTQLLVFNGNYEKVQKRANPDDEETGKIPNFVQYILIGLLGIYCIFPLIQYLQLSNTISYIDGEKYFIFASMISKVVLSWAVFGGAFRDDDSSYLNFNQNKDDHKDYIMYLILSFSLLFIKSWPLSLKYSSVRSAYFAARVIRLISSSSFWNLNFSTPVLCNKVSN